MSYLTNLLGNQEWSGSHSGPVPIPVQQARKNVPARNKYTSLKRTHSNVNKLPHETGKSGKDFKSNEHMEKIVSKVCLKLNYIGLNFFLSDKMLRITSHK